MSGLAEDAFEVEAGLLHDASRARVGSVVGGNNSIEVCFLQEETADRNEGLGHVAFAPVISSKDIANGYGIGGWVIADATNIANDLIRLGFEGDGPFKGVAVLIGRYPARHGGLSDA